MDIEAYRIEPGELVKLGDRPTDEDGGLSKSDGKKEKEKLVERMLELQELLHAEKKRSLLIVLQAMDAGGKDSTVRRVFGPLNPNWCRVSSFKEPTPNELARDFLWRIHAKTPPKGSIGIFNRSHYEDLVTVSVHDLAPRPVIEKRFDHVNAFEKLLVDEGTVILKFFIHISNEYQKERLERRLRRPDKIWKFDPKDLEERKRWDEYRQAYETAMSKCSTWYAPWYVIPGERRWYRDLLVAQTVVGALEEMKLSYPEPSFDPEKITVP